MKLRHWGTSSKEPWCSTTYIAMCRPTVTSLMEAQGSMLCGKSVPLELR